MRRLLLLGMGLAGLLAGCASPAPPKQAGPAATCRVGPDGTPPPIEADRGIGGTGMVADRGIGGTGIIGVITGFGSVCVAGEEVALPAATPTRIDDQDAAPADLRAGQWIALEAAGQQGALQARRITVRHVVVGPVQAVGEGTATVAGQTVLLAGPKPPKPGNWVAVSGARQPDGTIRATRLDPAPPGRVLLRGELIRIYGTARVAGLAVRLPDASALPGGFPVVAQGVLADGTLHADTVQLDMAAASPSAYFGETVDNYIVQTDVTPTSGGGFLVGRDFVRGEGELTPLGVVRYGRKPGGDLATPGFNAAFPADRSPLPAGSSGFGGGFGGGPGGPGAPGPRLRR